MNAVDGDGGDAGFSAFVHLPRHLNASDYGQRYRDGIEPDESPYGFHFARDFGVDVRFSRRPASSAGMVAKVVRLLLGFDLVNSWRDRWAMRDADVIWTMLDGEILGVAALMKAGVLPRRPVIGSTVWVVNDWAGYGPLRRSLYRYLLKEVACLFVHSEACLEPLRAIVPDVPVELLHFGISEATFADGNAKEQGAALSIVAAGNDRTRDWETLIAAFGGDERFHLTIICPWLDGKRAETFANVSIPRLDGMASLASLYRQADIIAVPMKANLFSGITVAIEAAMMGIPILSSRTGGVPTYFADDEAIFVPVGDPDSMRNAVLRLDPPARRDMAGRARQRAVRSDYSSRGMMRRYTDHSRQQLAFVRSTW